MDTVNQIKEIIERKGGKQTDVNKVSYNIEITKNAKLHFIFKGDIICIALFVKTENTRIVSPLLKCKYENAITDILLTDLIDMWVANYQLFL